MKLIFIKFLLLDSALQWKPGKVDCDMLTAEVTINYALSPNKDNTFKI